MIQPRDDKKEQPKEFKLKSLMLELDEYMRIFITPQIPAEFADMREGVRRTTDAAWHELYHAAMTSKRVRQSHLVNLRVEMAVLETYLQEIRDICYRGKEKRKLDKQSERRFEICAKKLYKVMNFIWGWAKNESKELDPAKSQKTVGLVEKEEMD